MITNEDMSLGEITQINEYEYAKSKSKVLKHKDKEYEGREFYCHALKILFKLVQLKQFTTYDLKEDG